MGAGGVGKAGGKRESATSHMRTKEGREELEEGSEKRGVSFGYGRYALITHLKGRVFHATYFASDKK